MFKDGLGKEETTEGYELEDKHYDDKRMKRAQKRTNEGKYNLCGVGGKKNNCQDYTDKLRNKYAELERGDKQR